MKDAKKIVGRRLMLGFNFLVSKNLVDLPPTSRATVLIMKSVNQENDGYEKKRIHLRAEHPLHRAGRGWHAGQFCCHTLLIVWTESAHRWRCTRLGQALDTADGDVLSAPSLWWTAAAIRSGQRVQNQVRPHGTAQVGTRYPLGKKVDDQGQVPPALPDPHTPQLRHAELVGPVCLDCRLTRSSGHCTALFSIVARTTLPRRPLNHMQGSEDNRAVGLCYL